MSTRQQEAGRRRVRAKGAEDRRTENMKFRTGGDLRAKIEAAAAKSGRTASGEVEIRLHNSFYLEPLHELYFGNGEDARKFINSLLVAIRSIQNFEHPKGHKIGSEDWMASEHTRVALRNAFKVILDEAAPRASKPEDLNEPVEKQSGYTRDLRHMEKVGEQYGLFAIGQIPGVEQ